MKKTGFIFKFLGKGKTRKTALTLILAVFICLSPLYGAENQRIPINVNLIIDGSSSFSAVKDEITTWVLNRMDAILAEGDNVTIWSAGFPARVIYSGRINGAADKDAVKNSIRQLSGSGETADFSGALRDASARQSSSISYTLLISASGASLSAVLISPQANFLRYSRVEEFTTWRALTVGLNIDTRVRRAAAAFFGQ
ncbi:MAG: hypothetical protein LBQ89_03800 [Treponema sp.]|jgi:hypothetical protein|nr:hypothetical protein [Treponema sp.]